MLWVLIIVLFAAFAFCAWGFTLSLSQEYSIYIPTKITEHFENEKTIEIKNNINFLKMD